MVPALDSPTCSMKATEAASIAMPWAASSTVPTQPIMIALAWKSPPSAMPVTPMGQPRRKTPRSAAGSARQKRWNSR